MDVGATIILAAVFLIAVGVWMLARDNHYGGGCPECGTGEPWIYSTHALDDSRIVHREYRQCACCGFTQRLDTLTTQEGDQITTQTYWVESKLGG